MLAAGTFVESIILHSIEAVTFAARKLAPAHAREWAWLSRLPHPPMFDKRRLGRTTRRWWIVNIAVPIRRRQGAFAPHVLSRWTNDSVPAGSMHTDPKVRNCDTGRQPDPFHVAGRSCGSRGGPDSIVLPEPSAGVQHKGPQPFAAGRSLCCGRWVLRRSEGWGPGSSRCCRQLISHRMPVLGSRTWQLPVGAVVLLRVAASILRRQPKGRASRLPGDHRRTGVSSREFCQLSF